MVEYIIKVKRKKHSILTDGWVWRMAWRDARHNYSRLFLFMASLVAGIASVVALDSMNNSLQGDINNNAKELLGADLVISGEREFPAELIAKFDSLKLPQASEADMASMVLFLRNQQSRLIRLVALEGAFPFYGAMETKPLGAYEKMKGGGYALLDETLASQYEVSTGDSLRLGGSVFAVAGVVSRVPGGGGMMATFTPSVYISMRDLDSTNLVQRGSRVNYKQYIKTTGDEQTEKTLTELKPFLRKDGYSYETVEGRKEGLGEGFNSIYQFFSLLAFIALILGCIGVASAVHIYVREKREEVAVLRCVGSSGWQAFNIFFIQIFCLGIAGSIAGSFAGLAIQQVIPILLEGIVPFEMSTAISWKSVALGIAIGTIISLLFSVVSLVAVRFVPPLAVLRTDFNPGRTVSKMRIVAIVLIILFPVAFVYFQTNDIIISMLFTAGVLVALALLTGLSAALLFFVRKYFPYNAAFAWRHALSNLFRPNNQTTVLMVTIGLGAFIISTLNIIEQSLLGQVEFSGQENQSNTILFDIQPSQREGVLALLEKNKLEVNQIVPIITCRLDALKGKTVEAIQKDTTDKIPNWALMREYRVTYRDSLHLSEELVKGELHQLKPGRDSIWVTISEGMEETLEVTVGDSVLFDIQGIPMKVFIAGVRKVDWPKDPPNFIFVFPPGVLEYAPQFFVTATRVESQAQANIFQQALVLNFPNVSLIDLRLILNTVNELFNKLGLIIRFLAMFSFVTGLVVLAGAVINSRFVRMKENVLLRTVGAGTRIITKITLIEYAYLGLFSAFAGMILSVGGGWLLTTFFFEITFAFDWLELSLIAAGVIFLTMFIGWFNSREVINTPPLQVLRKET